MQPHFSASLKEINSALRIPCVSIALSNGWVPTIDQIYRDNLRLLIEEVGTQEALSEKTGKSAAQISQWLNASKDSKTGKPRSMSRSMAREIERLCSKPEGWMDRAHIRPHQGGDEPPPPGERYDALSLEEQRMVDALREIWDEDERRQWIEDLTNQAAKSRAQREKILAPYGITLPPPKHQADAKKLQIARSAMEITDSLKQRSLLDPSEGKPPVDDKS